MNKESALSKLNKLKHEIPALKLKKSDNPDFKTWYRNVEVAIINIFTGKSKHLKDFNSIRFTLMMCSSETPDYAFENAYKEGLDHADAIINSFICEIEEYWTDERADKMKIEWQNIFDRFHKIVSKLRKRYNSRPPFEIEDEYDVQDLSYSLLHLFFDDIRKEEWTPSYAGAASRVDFLIKEIKTIIEIKKTRKGLSDKEIGEQLIIDVARYKSHPDCQNLVCFVYDPEGRISNPDGICNDLRTIKDLKVEVIIRPVGI